MKKYKRTYKTRSYSTRREGCFVSEFLLLVQSEISFPSLRHDHPRIVNHPSQELSTSKATIFALRPLFFFKHLRCPLCVKRHFMVFLPSNIWDELYFNLLEKWEFSANHSLSHPDLESYRRSRHAADASMSISCMSLWVERLKKNLSLFTAYFVASPRLLRRHLCFATFTSFLHLSFGASH